MPILQNAIGNPERKSNDWDSGNSAFTILGLAAWILILCDQDYQTFRTMLLSPFPFRDQVRPRFNHLRSSDAVLTQQEQMHHKGAHTLETVALPIELHPYGGEGGSRTHGGGKPSLI